MGKLQGFLYAVANNAGIINYSQNGYNSRNLAPTGSNAYVDNQYNVTKALLDGNKVIILCNTSNDFYSGSSGGVMTVRESMANTRLIADACEKAGATLFVVSSFPRDVLSESQRDSLRVMAGLLKQKFGDRCAYVYRLLESNTNPGLLNPAYQMGDGTHLNDAGSNVAFAAVRDMLTAYFNTNSQISKYQVQRKPAFSSAFSNFQFVDQPNNPELSLAADSNYYRVRIEYTNGYYSKWSNTVQGTLAHQDSVYEQPPLVTVTAPVILFLPTNSTTLVASASDPNAGGSIASYQWQKVMGGTATLTNATTSSLSVSNLAEGTYVFRCQVKNNINLSFYADAIVTVRTADSSSTAVKFNFNLSPQNVSGWIDVSDGPFSTNNINKAWTGADNISLVNLPNAATKWGANFYGNSDNANGQAVADAGGFVISSAVIGSGWYSNSKVYTDTSSNQMKLTGLSPSKAYKLKFYSSLSSSLSLDANPTMIVVNNSVLNHRLVNAVGNTSNVVIFRGIVPSAGGEVPFFVGVPFGQAQFGMINGLSVEEDTLPGTNGAPQVTGGSSQTITLPANVATLSATAFDPDGPLQSVTWTQVYGPGATILTPDQLTSNVTLGAAGTYIFRCTAKDNYNATGYADVQVIVEAASTNPVLYVGVSSEDYTLSGWTVLYGAPHSTVISGTGMLADSTVAISTIATANWTPLFGYLTSDKTGETVDDGNGFVAPLRAQQGAFFNINTYNSAKPQFALSNLPNGTYKVTMFGSLQSSVVTSLGANMNTEFRVNAGTAQTINTASNTSQKAVFNGIVVSDGTMNLFFNPTTGGSSSYIGMCNFFILEKTD